MLKKLISIALVACMALTFAACSNEKDVDNETDAKTEVTTEETEAVTEKETEAPTEAATEEEDIELPTDTEKIYEYEEIFKIDFSKMEDGPFTANKVQDIENLRIEDGKLCGTSTSEDPFFNITEGIEFSADDVQLVVIKVNNYSEDRYFQFFFTNEKTGWSEDASMRAYYDHYYIEGYLTNYLEIWTKDSSLWAGSTINGIRLDITEGQGDFAIESITFYSVPEN